MSQIININVGKAGVRIGEKFIRKIAQEHFQGTNDVRGKVDVFFHQTEEGPYEARALFLDIDPRTIDSLNLKTQPYSILEKNLFKGSGLFSDLFSEGYYHQGAQIAAEAINNLHREVQKCDRLGGFLICNNIAGGTGSGMTNVMLDKLRNFYCDRIVQHHFVLPEPDHMMSPLQVYNAVLALNLSIQLADFCVMTENKAMEKRTLMAQQNFRPTLNHINELHAEHICQITAPYRFSGSLNSNQRKTCTNLTPFPRIKYMISSISGKGHRQGSLQEVFNPINYSKSDFFANKTSYSDIYTIQVNSRDNMGYESEIDNKVRLWASEKKYNFADWIPNNIHMTITEQQPSGPSSSMLINSRNVSNIFERWADMFRAQFRRNAFTYHYYSGGMDPMEFTQAESNLNDLISEHRPCLGYDEELEDDPE